MELSTTHQPAADTTAPFMFQDLPGEIRNKIYKILLCTFDDPISWPPDDQLTLRSLRNDVYPQILRTCRKVYYEGTCVMHRTNLFIKLEIITEPVELLEALKKVPFLMMKPSHMDTLKGFVISHRVVYRNTQEDACHYKVHARPTMELVLLHRDLHHLCKALSVARWNLELYEHIITFTDPYSSGNCLHLPPFFSRKLQEELVAPYGSGLKGFPHFTLRGIIPEDIAIATTSMIKIMPDLYDDNEMRLFLYDKLHLCREGRCYYNRRLMMQAIMSWAECRLRIRAGFAGTNGELLFKSGGFPLIMRIVSMYGFLFRNITNAAIYLMKTVLQGKAKELDWTVITVIRTGHDFNSCIMRYRHILTLRLHDLCTARIHYNLAVCFRLSENKIRLRHAQSEIDKALAALPNYPLFLAEKEKIELAIRNQQGTA